MCDKLYILVIWLIQYFNNLYLKVQSIGNFSTGAGGLKQHTIMYTNDSNVIIYHRAERTI